MNLQLITSCIIVVGIVLTVYCMLWLGSSLRVVVRQMEEIEASDDGHDKEG
jgi:hypothetical protein